MSCKYRVGDLLTTGLYLYLVVDIKEDKYIAKETSNRSSSNLWWKIRDADSDRNLKKVN